jgi:hypothetical protein
MQYEKCKGCKPLFIAFESELTLHCEKIRLLHLTETSGHMMCDYCQMHKAKSILRRKKEKYLRIGTI